MGKDLKENYGTLSETINGLSKEGYTHDFNIIGECIHCHQTNITLSPEDFQIDKIYRFEGISDPDDQSILYAISSSKLNVKGVLVNGYGVYADDTSSQLVEKLRIKIYQRPLDIKANDATSLRPEGERYLNAQLVEMDLDAYIKQIKSESTWATSDRNSITILKTETMRIVLIALHENATLKPHKTNGIISVQVLEGKIEFATNQQSILIEKGQMVALQDNITHSVLALTESCFLLTISMNK